jgi:hypothetical protein
MGLHVVAVLEIDGTQEKWELKMNEMRQQRQQRRWWA